MSGVADKVADLSPENKALLVEIMRQQLAAAEAEIERLTATRLALVEWLAANDPTLGR